MADLNLRQAFATQDGHFDAIKNHRAGTKVFAKLFDLDARETLAERNYYLAEISEADKEMTLHGDMAPRVEGQQRPSAKVYKIPVTHLVLEVRVPEQSVAPQTRLRRARSVPAAAADDEIGPEDVEAIARDAANAANAANASNNGAALDPAVLAQVMNTMIQRFVAPRLQQLEDRAEPVEEPEEVLPPRVQLMVGKFQVLAVPTTDTDANTLPHHDASKWKLFGDFSCRRSMGVPEIYFSPAHMLEGDKQTVLKRLSTLASDITAAVGGLMQGMKSMNPTVEAMRIGTFGGVTELTNSIDAYVAFLTNVARGWYPQTTVQWYPMLWMAVNVMAGIASRAIGHHHGGNVVQLNFVAMKKKGHFDPLALTEQRADVPVPVAKRK